MLDLEPAAQTMGRTTAGITDDQLELRTPCDAPVSAVLAHVVNLSIAFREAGRKVTGPITDSAPGLAESTLPADWRQQLPVLLDALVEAWRGPEAWEGTTHIAGMDMPAADVGVVATNELVLHGWDLAVATGQAYEPADEAVATAWQMVSHTPDDPAVRGGLFGPVVAVPDGAPLLDRLLGGAGRDPRWAPAG